jgi:biotin transport system substrate-specific component
VVAGATVSFTERLALKASTITRAALMAAVTAAAAQITFGATWLAVISGLTPTEAIATGILPFVIFDLIKVGLAALVAVAAAPAIGLPRT